MAKVKEGDKVKVHYTGKLEDGTVFDTSIEREPLEFTVANGEVIPGFEESVVGMNPGDSKIVEVSPDKAYGPHLEKRVVEVNKEHLSDELEPEVGQQLQLQQKNGETFTVIVTDITDSVVTLDANHPLAGENLTFEIELVEIVK